MAKNTSIKNACQACNSIAITRTAKKQNSIVLTHNCINKQQKKIKVYEIDEQEILYEKYLKMFFSVKNLDFNYMAENTVNFNYNLQLNGVNVRPFFRHEFDKKCLLDSRFLYYIKWFC